MVEIRFLGRVDLQGISRAPDGLPEIRALLRQPKRIALLAYLLLSPDGSPRRRDTILTFLWPELDEARGRAALRQLIYNLRRSLGADAISSNGDDDLSLGGSQLTSDVRAFQAAVVDGRHSDALELYGGDLLAGFFVSDVAPEFEQWLDGERDRLRAMATKSAWSLVDSSVERRDATAALFWARRALGIVPDDESALRKFLDICDRVGDRAAALRAYEDFSTRMQRDLDAEPSPETQRVFARIRERSIAHRSGDWVTKDVRPAARHASVTAVATPPATPSPAALPSARRIRRLRRAGAISLGVVIIASLAFVVPALTRERAVVDTTRVLAVGAIRDHTGDTTGLARVIGDMVTTGIASRPELRIISSARMYELLMQVTPTRTPNSATPADFERAARAAGAQEYVEGSLYRQPDGMLRLDLRRIDLASGTMRAIPSVSAREPFALADRAITLFSVGSRGDRGIADMTTHSLAAYRLYEEGLRAYTAQDFSGAVRLFGAAVEEDSGFARAVLYLATAKETGGNRFIATAESLYVRAMHLADRGPEYDRLFIRALAQEKLEDRGFRVTAESLAARYPDELRPHLMLAKARITSGDFLAAVPEFERVIAMDSLGLQGKRPDCAGCQAYQGLTSAYWAADSGVAAQRVVRRWLARRPDAAAWFSLVRSLTAAGAADEAVATALRCDSLFPDADIRFALLSPTLIQLRRFAQVDSLLGSARLDSRAARRFEASWYLLISLRHQGRVEEARQLALSLTRQQSLDRPFLARQAYAQTLYETGRFQESARLREELAADVLQTTTTEGRRSRHRAWQLTHTGEAFAAAKDTQHLAVLMDSVESIGARSGYGRDHLLHHHLRGLLWVARGRPDSATLEFRRALWSPTSGYTRSNLELGRLLIAAGKPRDAVLVLAPALRAGIEASTLYVTPAELHELLARAFASAGARDSARVHYRAVVESWSNGDTPFRERATAARKALAELGAKP